MTFAQTGLVGAQERAVAESDSESVSESETETVSESESESESETETDDGISFYGSLGGEYRLRGVAMSDIPLTPFPFRPEGTGELGQNYWAEQWLRARAEVGIRGHLRLVGQVDVLYGVAFGELAQGTRPAAWARDELGYPGLRLRHLYLEWNSPIGVVRVGQMGFSWGMGIVANGGETPPVFGDYRYGDLVRRILLATQPFGADSHVTIAAAVDWVAWDLTADADRPCAREGQSGCGDTAFQGVLAAYYAEGRQRVGGYVAYRTQKNYLGDHLDVFVGDVHAHFELDEPTGGRFLLEAEAAYVRGTTSLTRTADRPVSDVEQLLVAAQLGRLESTMDVVLEGGYASGDSNVEDGVERRGTFDPDHRVGLVLFPEVIAWQTARSAFLGQSADLFGRPGRGAELLPTNGGVAGAFYLFPYTIIRPADFIDIRLGGVVAWATADVVDPWRVRAESRVANYRGGDPSRRDLGLEVDAAIRLHGEIAAGVTLSGGLEGGLLFPGHAFDDAEGRTMGEVGLARLRVGLSY